MDERYIRQLVDLLEARKTWLEDEFEDEINFDGSDEYIEYERIVSLLNYYNGIDL